MKKTGKFISVLVMFLIASNTVFSADFMYGDGDNDGAVTSTDGALAIKNSLLGIYVKSLDVDGNRVLNSTDAALIIKKALNNAYIFPVETAAEFSTEFSTENTTEDITEDITQDVTQSEEDTTISVEDIAKVPESFEITTTVSSFAEFNAAVSDLAGNVSPSAIYVTDDIDCNAQVKLTAKNANLSIIGVQKADGTYPAFDFTSFRDSQSKISKDSQTGFYISGSGYNFKNLIVEKAPDCGFRIKGNSAGNCILENLIVRYNNNSGISITSGASNNTIRSCDIYRNCDLVQALGSDADGVSIKLDSGDNNINYNVRVWENGDDGWDSFGAHGSISYIECMCFHNGDADIFSGKYDYDNNRALDKNLIYVQAILAADPDFETKFNNREVESWPVVNVKLLGKTVSGSKINNLYWSGNPNGFKFGSWSSNSNCDGYVDKDVYRYVKNCLAFGHGAKGFDQNNCKATISLQDTVGFDNGRYAGKPNYFMSAMTAVNFDNAVSFDGNVEDLPPMDTNGNSGSFSTVVPDGDVQAQIRGRVDETFGKIRDAVESNNILGEVLFDIYDLK